MHTFFINTSSKELNDYDVLFDIHRENKTLVTMNYPMSDWYDKDKGYVACIKEMGDAIDGYVELNNTFNLIIYIDLPENKVYSSIARGMYHDNDRDECCQAMHLLFTRVIRESIVKELADEGRRPQNVLIMFGEEKKFTEIDVPATNPNEGDVKKKVLNFMGIPSSEVIAEIAKQVKAENAEDKISAFREKFMTKRGEELVPGLHNSYSEALELWCEKIVNEENIDGANAELFDTVKHIDRVGSVYANVEAVSCPYDCKASKVNKSVLALSKMNMAIYLLKCVESNSIFEPSDGGADKRLIEFHKYTADEIGSVLEKKKNSYSEMIKEIEGSSKTFTEKGLAEKPSSFDYAKFGLDEDGYKKDEPEKESEKEPEKKSKKLLEDITIAPNSDESQTAANDGNPSTYRKNAKARKDLHANYLKILRSEISKTLANYAGKSRENKPAKLQVGKKENYAVDGKEEDRTLGKLEEVSVRSYKAMVDQYMEFCAGRSVTITDIEEQYNWFVAKIDRIEKGFKKLSTITVGLLAAVLALYIPYFVIQFEAIFQNPLTFSIAAGAIATPVVLLLGILLFAKKMKRKEYKCAWNDFIGKSKDALEENDKAVKEYEKLLSTIIPALRWVYDYKLDVAYYAECCRVATAKEDHHKGKLRERIDAIEDILHNLEYDGNIQFERGKNARIENIDFAVPFCSGEKNRKFYLVINSQMLGDAKRKEA